ncbi:MAG: hypothetical protein KIS78_24260 [Labilithrix sp.]|nr:hypothetical protein [Labilithrix sp.]
MAGPSQAWLASIDPASLDFPPDTLTPRGAQFAPPPAVYNAPPPAEPWKGDDPLAGLGPPSVPKGAGAFGGGYDPLGDREATWNPPREPTSFTREDPAAPTPTGAPAPEPLGPLPHDVQTMQVSRGGVVPAHEAPTRGPMQEGLLMASFEPELAAADAIEARSREHAQREASVYEEQAREALGRKEALEKVATQRADEMRAMQEDFEQHIQSLGKASLDRNRLWGNASTGDKIGATVMLFLGGLFGGDDNKVEQALNKQIDEDIAAQKFDYERGLDIARGKQTAFGMAMQRYQSEDAATAVARAAALDYTMARVNEKAAEGRGVDASNQADTLRGIVAGARLKAASEGIKYVPSSVVAPRYKQSIRGYELPGTVSEMEARQNVIKRGIEPAEKTDEILTKGGVEMTIKRAEAANKRAEKSDDGAKYIASALQQANIPQTRAMGERAIKALNESPGGKAEAAGRFALSTPPVVGKVLPNMVMDEKANAREQAYSDFMNSAMKATFGNVTASEEVRAAKSYGATGDPEARRRSINAVLQTLDEMERNIRAGASPEAQDTYDQHRDAATPGRPAAPKGAKDGW